MSYQPLEAGYRDEYPRLQKTAEALRGTLARIFRGNEDVVLIEARAKNPTSFVRKASTTKENGNPRYADPLGDIQDQVGCRIVVRSPRAIRPVIERAQVDFNSIEDQPRPARIDPSSFGYEAWHVIFLIPEPMVRRHDLSTQVFELQVSTPFQYAWAVMEHDLIYKPQRPQPTYEQRRAVHAAAALAYAADELFEFAQVGPGEPKQPAEFQTSDSLKQAAPRRRPRARRPAAQTTRRPSLRGRGDASRVRGR